LFFPTTASTGTVVIAAHNNLFASGSVFRDARKVATANTATRWQEGENLFQMRAYIENPAYVPGSFPVRTLAEWNKWWMLTNASGRAVNIEFVFDRSRPGRRDGRDESEFRLSMFAVTNLNVVEGPPLNRDQWAQFGADIANVGPRSGK
jgi:hypothetical protein